MEMIVGIIEWGTIITNRLDYERNVLCNILNNESESCRLLEMVDALHNLYSREGEIMMLSCLNDILKTGFESKHIDSIDKITIYEQLI